jgi:Protein of unknown function (DUF3616)
MKTRHPNLTIRSLVTIVVVTSLAVLCYLTFFGNRARPHGDLISDITPFAGVPLEASGVAAVPGTDGVLIVDNGRNSQVFWMRLDASGKQVGAIKTIPLGVNIEDIEGITGDGTYFYVVSSQSRPKAIASAGLVRFKFDPHSQTVTEVVSIGGLKNYLIANVEELRQEADRKGRDGGINIEGLAWDPKQNQLLLGLRSPVIAGQALVVPLKSRDSRAAFSANNLEVPDSKAIRLSLAGIGIRSIEYDDRSSVFHLISGAPADQSQTDFGLWEWNGDRERPGLRETNRFDRRLKPEGIAKVSVGNSRFLIVVYDAGGYTTIQ